MTVRNFTTDPETIKAVPRVDICSCQVPLDFEFSMAFQPIWDVRRGRLFGYEALVRGINGESAGEILSQVTRKNKYAFDQACRVTAIRMATKLGLSHDQFLSINFLPNAIYDPETCIRATLEAANRFNFPHRNILFEMTEQENMADTSHFKAIIEAYKRLGFTTAIDDFGEGFSGLNLLARFQPDIIKIDMALVQGCADSRVKQGILEGIVLMSERLGIELIAEGIENWADMNTLMSLGVPYYQGFRLARPGFEALPGVDPDTPTRSA